MIGPLANRSRRDMNKYELVVVCRCIGQPQIRRIQLGEKVGNTTAVIKDDKAGVPIIEPTGGHAVYIDAKKFLSHMKPEKFPGWTLANELYLEGGIRGVEIGNVMFGQPDSKGKMVWPKLDLVRLAIPRRVYTKSHFDYVIETFKKIAKNKKKIKGCCIEYEAPVLRHFTIKMKPAK